MNKSELPDIIIYNALLEEQKKVMNAGLNITLDFFQEKELRDKFYSLKKLGFTSIKESQLLEREDKANHEKTLWQNYADGYKYPFISEEAERRVRTTYTLITTSVEDLVTTPPAKSLQDILGFMVNTKHFDSKLFVIRADERLSLKAALIDTDHTEALPLTLPLVITTKQHLADNYRSLPEPITTNPLGVVILQPVKGGFLIVAHY